VLDIHPQQQPLLQPHLHPKQQRLQRHICSRSRSLQQRTGLLMKC
jgi:hypothetical protein